MFLFYVGNAPELQRVQSNHIIEKATINHAIFAFISIYKGSVLGFMVTFTDEII